MLDLRQALDVVKEGYVLSARQLEGIGSTLKAVFEAKSTACYQGPSSSSSREAVLEGPGQAAGTREEPSGTSTSDLDIVHEQDREDDGSGNGRVPQFKYPELEKLARPIDDGELATLRAIEECIQVRVCILLFCL